MPDSKPDGGITNAERGLDAGAKLNDRTAAPPKSSQADAPKVDTPTESKYWKQPTKVHHVVFPNAKFFIDAHFDFKSTGSTGERGTALGLGAADDHYGTYKVIKNTPDAFEMQLAIETKKEPNKINMTLSIGKDGATARGTKEGKKLDSGAPLPVGGSGTKADPFRVKFPNQELQWYLP
jgi:hypothetical protein